MFRRYLKLISLHLTLFLFVFEAIGLSYAAMTMEEVQSLFEKEMDKKWEQVTSDERKDFLYKIRGKEQVEEREERVEGVKIPFHIREGFERSKGKKWEDATEEEQKGYIEKYKMLKEKWDLKEQERLEKIRIQKEKRQEELEKQNDKLARQMEKRKEKKIREQEKEQERREKEKERIERAKEKLRETREKAKERRDR